MYFTTKTSSLKHIYLLEFQHINTLFVSFLGLKISHTIDMKFGYLKYIQHNYKFVEFLVF